MQISDKLGKIKNLLRFIKIAWDKRECVCVREREKERKSKREREIDRERERERQSV